MAKKGGGAIPHRTVNKEASRTRQEQQHMPSNQEQEACKSGSGRKTPQKRGEGPLPT
jgi:hypothetical protein